LPLLERGLGGTSRLGLAGRIRRAPCSGGGEQSGGDGALGASASALAGGVARRAGGAQGLEGRALPIEDFDGLLAGALGGRGEARGVGQVSGVVDHRGRASYVVALGEQFAGTAEVLVGLAERFLGALREVRGLAGELDVGPGSLVAASGEYSPDFEPGHGCGRDLLQQHCAKVAGNVLAHELLRRSVADAMPVVFPTRRRVLAADPLHPLVVWYSKGLVNGVRLIRHAGQQLSRTDAGYLVPGPR